MKSRIFIAVLIVVLLVGGFFLPTKSGLRDEVEPESNPITVFQEVEEEQQAAERERKAARKNGIAAAPAEDSGKKKKKNDD